MVTTSACHAEDRGFNPRRDRHFFIGSVAQSVEQGTENPCVGGSIPLGATIFVFFALVAQLDRAFGYGPKGYGFDSYRAHHYFFRIGKWLSLVEHYAWDVGVAGSNPVFPTI